MIKHLLKMFSARNDETLMFGQDSRQTSYCVRCLSGASGVSVSAAHCSVTVLY